MTHFARLSMSSHVHWFTLLVGLTACGGGAERPPKSQDATDQEVQTRRSSDGMQASSEVGGLDEDKVDAAFKSALGAIGKCLNSGAERVEFIGGSVSFFLKIDTSGSVQHAHLEKSTLGDRPTETCMLSALRARKWPKPVGGDVGLARKSFDFDPPNDVRAPIDWDADQVAPALEKLSDTIAECKQGTSGSFEATLYVGTDGAVLAASVTPPDEDGDAAVDCLVDALKAGEFESPGSWPAKVTFSL